MLPVAVAGRCGSLVAFIVAVVWREVESGERAWEGGGWRVESAGPWSAPAEGRGQITLRWMRYATRFVEHRPSLVKGDHGLSTLDQQLEHDVPNRCTRVCQPHLADPSQLSSSGPYSASLVTFIHVSTLHRTLLMNQVENEWKSQCPGSRPSP